MKSYNLLLNFFGIMFKRSHNKRRIKNVAKCGSCRMHKGDFIEQVVGLVASKACNCTDEEGSGINLGIYPRNDVFPR